MSTTEKYKVILYGLSPSICDTIKKARRWLNNAGIEYHFHDYRKDGLDEQALKQWSAELGWEQLLNRRSTTWRKLPEDQKAAMDEALAIQLMLEQPAMIKRPLLDNHNQKTLGFSEQLYKDIFGL